MRPPLSTRQLAARWAAGIALFLIVVVGTSWAGFAGCNVAKNWHRNQKLKDAVNQTRIVKQQIRTAQQQAEIVEAQNARVRALGQQRIITAQALAKAQALIHSTLTPLYVQFEAIEAQKAIATSGRNNTVIYVPSGTNGTPVLTSSPQDLAGAGK